MTKGNLKIVIIALSVLVFFGGLYIFKNSSSGNKSEDNNVESSNQQENEVKDNYYYTTVDNLSVRRYPSLDAKRISSLDEGVRVTYLGSESANVISVKLRGEQTTGPFYFIRTDSGKEGWVYSGALSSTPVYVEDYEAIVVFSEYVGVDDSLEYLVEEIEGYLNKNNRSDIKVILKTDDFDEETNLFVSNDNNLLPLPLRDYIQDVDSPRSWKRIGIGLFEQALDFGDNFGSAKLYRIAPGSSVPSHSHDGNEVTLVLSGGFTDEYGTYGPGDISIQETGAVHKPVADDDGECIVLAVNEGPIVLTGPVGRLLNMLRK